MRRPTRDSEQFSPRSCSASAARLCAVAGPDGIVVSREALQAGGRPVVGLQRFVLKGIKEPVEATALKWEA